MCFSSGLKSLRTTFLGLFVLFCLLAISACGGGNSARVYDNARVLNVSKVQSAASNLSHPVAVYTTNTFQGTQADFQRATIQKLNGNPDMIVMAIDTGHRYLYIARGSNVPLSSAGINRAVSTFSARFSNGDYTSASVAALNSMNSSIGAGSSSRNNSGGLFAGPGLAWCIIPLLILMGLLLFGASRRSRMSMARMGQFNRGGSPFGSRVPPDQNPYTGPADQEPYGPSERGRGMNPWAAGGFGAAAGGIAGYELGRRQGERERESQQDDEFGGGGGSFGGGDAGGGGSFGGDSGGGGSFGGGDFGGDSFGGGGNFDGSSGGGGSFGGDDFGQRDDAGGGNF